MTGMHMTQDLRDVREAIAMANNYMDELRRVRREMEDQRPVTLYLLRGKQKILARVAELEAVLFKSLRWAEELEAEILEQEASRRE